MSQCQRAPVRLSIWTGCLLAAASMYVGSASGQSAKWCAINSVGGGTNCGFVSMDQCRASISGVGGVCEPRQVVPANLSPAAKADAPTTDSGGAKDNLIAGVTDSCKINRPPNVKKRYRPKWCPYFKEPA